MKIYDLILGKDEVCSIRWLLAAEKCCSLMGYSIRSLHPPLAVFLGHFPNFHWLRQFLLKLKKNSNP